MRDAPPRMLCAALLAALALGAAGCGKGGSQRTASGAEGTPAPVSHQGAISLATRNTTRLGGEEPAADAAAVARLVYPGLTPHTRPGAAVLVDERDWPAALAASVLASKPLHAPLLYSEGDAVPAISGEALEAMHPSGAPQLAGLQLIRVGSAAPAPGGYTQRSLPHSEAAAQAAAIAGLLREADGGHAPRAVIVLASAAPPALAMPAAGLSAQSGAPILYVDATRVPPATAGALSSMHRPSIYVLGASGVAPAALKALSAFGRVSEIRGPASREAEPAALNAIAVARFTDGTFGWGVKEPGHGLTFANVARPLDAPASALLSSTGDYAPLLLLERAAGVPPRLASYLADIQPAYTSSPQFGPVRGVYNHGWLIGDERAIAAVTQAELDSMLEISPRKATPEEPSVSAGG